MRYLILSLLMISSIVISAQNDSILFKNNHLYVNKSSPVYIYLSDLSDKDAPAICLKGSEEDKYSNPFYFDTESTNTIYIDHPVKLKNEDKSSYISKLVYHVSVDGLPPVTHYKLKNVKTIYKNGHRCYKAGLKISMYARDKISGLKNIYYSINDEDFIEYNSEIELWQAGDYTIKYFSEDNVGNKEQEKKIQITVL